MRSAPSVPVFALALCTLAHCSGTTVGAHDAAATDDGALIADTASDSPALDTATDSLTPDAADAGAPTDSPASTDAPMTSGCVEIGTLDPWANRLGTHTLADRGTILSCVHSATLTAAEVTATPYFTAHAWTATNGYESFIVQYVSEGSPGTAVAVTALLYLPQTAATHVPIVAVDHATSGMGPGCGPTHATVVTDYMAIPLVGNGYAVVATDYDGMGVDTGVAPYGIGDNEAAGALDSVRALLQFHDSRFDASQLGTDFFVMGHSQGGQASLFTQQDFDPSIGVNLLGSISFAPGFGSLTGFNLLFEDSSRALNATDLFIAMALYADMTWFATPAASAWLSPAAVSALPGMLHDQCLTSLLFSVPTSFPTIGSLYTSSFITSAATCSFVGSCPAFTPWATELSAGIPGAFTSTAPALILQGEMDTTVSPSSTKCVVDRLMAHGTPVSGCAYAADDHLSIVGSAIGDAMRWMTARRGGTTVDVCTATIAEACE